MLAVRTIAGLGFYGIAGENTAVFSTVRTGRPPLLWFHGNNQTASSDYMAYNYSLRLLAQKYTVVVADFGFNTFGNDLGITRVGQVLNYVTTALHLTDPAVFVASSAGVPVAMNYAVRNPTEVRAVAGIIPVVDLATTGPGQTQLDAAYPPAYDDDNPAHRSHNPLHFASDFPAEMPIGLWVSSNDPAVPPSTATAFVAERPQTSHTVFGAYGHGGVNEAMPLVLDWLSEGASS